LIQEYCLMSNHEMPPERYTKPTIEHVMNRVSHSFQWFSYIVEVRHTFRMHTLSQVWERVHKSVWVCSVNTHLMNGWEKVYESHEYCLSIAKSINVIKRIHPKEGMRLTAFAVMINRNIFCQFISGH
jgi:hypothetical protein